MKNRKTSASDIIGRLQKNADPNNPPNAYDYRDQMVADRARELGYGKLEVNGVRYIRTDKIGEATHWQPKTADAKLNISRDRIYKYFEMPDYPFGDDEYWIVDDIGQASMAYLCTPGHNLKREDQIMERLEERDFLSMTEEEKHRRFHICIESMKLSKEKLELYDEFEAAAERAGGYIDITVPKSPSYNIQKMHKWCVANNRDIETLTPAEREMFKSKTLGPRVKNVIPNKDDYTLILHFDNGEVKVFNVKPYMDKGIFQQLKDPEVFAAVRTFHGSICWKGGQDFCPDTLYLKSKALIPKFQSPEEEIQFWQEHKDDLEDYIDNDIVVNMIPSDELKKKHAEKKAASFSSTRRRPNDEPRYIPKNCEDCGEKLIYKYLIDDPDCPENERWYDEFTCPKCKNGIYWDIPKHEQQRLLKGLNTPLSECVEIEDTTESKDSKGEKVNTPRQGWDKDCQRMHENGDDEII